MVSDAFLQPLEVVVAETGVGKTPGGWMSREVPRELDLLPVMATPPGVVVRRLEEEDFDPLYDLAMRHFGGDIATREVVRGVVEHNPEAAYAIGRVRKDETFRPFGYVALLMLNEHGVTILRHGRLDAQDPSMDCLVDEGVPPAAIYVWGLVATGKAIAGLPRIMELLQTEPYRHADLYARPATEAGLRLLKALNFVPCVNAASAEDGELYTYRRIANRKIFERPARSGRQDRAAPDV